ncbi:MAG TPA: UvrB/UvrC motif-containing protein [Sedimentisphaerales bacterium]|nr:UvrB/UvrC motif-containing protein [Sedimentisphaerales bacterium]
MNCQVCNKNEATIHLTEITNGIRTEMHICERCAAKQEIVIKNQVPVNELLSNLLASQPSEQELLGQPDGKTSCPYCGFSLAQFNKEAVLGCPYDYEVFEHALLPLVKRAHDGRTFHCGKIPSKTPADARKQIELLSMRQKLDQAIRNEDYETAARLRDEIAKMQ